MYVITDRVVLQQKYEVLTPKIRKTWKKTKVRAGPLGLGVLDVGCCRVEKPKVSASTTTSEVV